MNRLVSLVSFPLFIISLLLLVLYSYTQIDLGLSLSRFEMWHLLQRNFQEIGYFRRDISALLYLGILVGLGLSYLSILYGLYRKLFAIKTVWILSVISACVLFFSYNAFSYDLFNYIFDAKIITTYGENPYLKKALDYPEDPMLGFMRWTHRVYPYGPMWLMLSVPLSYMAMGSLLLNMLLFKGIAAVSYLALVWGITQIAKHIRLENVAFHIGLVAFNPLVLIESLVSAHNDIVMMALLVLGLLLYIKARFFSSIFVYGLSVGIKFATGFLVPVFAYLYIKRGNVTNWQTVITSSFLCMFAAVIVASSRTQFQPWYLLYIIPFAALSTRLSIVIPTGIVSIGSLFLYLPYIYVGNYDAPVPFVMALTVSVLCILSAVVLSVVYFIAKHKRSASLS